MTQVNAVMAWSVLLRLKGTCSCIGDFSTFLGMTGHSQKACYHITIGTTILIHLVFFICVQYEIHFRRTPAAGIDLSSKDPPVNICRLLNWKRLAPQAPLFPLSHPHGYSSEPWVNMLITECSCSGMLTERDQTRSETQSRKVALGE